jgi:hypothetical protein
MIRMLRRLLAPLTLLLLLAACSFNPIQPGTPDPTARIELYEGNNATQDFLCRLDVPLSRTDGFVYVFTQPHSQECENDEARSLVLHNVHRDLHVQVFDDSNCSRSDSATLIVVKREIARKVIGSFEYEVIDDDVELRLLARGNLDGKVSCIVVGYGVSPVASWRASDPARSRRSWTKALLPLRR